MGQTNTFNSNSKIHNLLDRAISVRNGDWCPKSFKFSTANTNLSIQ